MSREPAIGLDTPARLVDGQEPRAVAGEAGRGIRLDGLGSRGGRLAGIWREIERSALGAPPPGLPFGWRPEAPDDACPRCGGTVGEGEAGLGGCAECRGTRLPWAHAVRLGAYDDELAEGILSCKYRGDRESGRRLGAMLGGRVRTRLAGLGLAGPGRLDRGVVVVPVPCTMRRRVHNDGVDHALVIARGVARSLGTDPSLLLRRRGSARQAAAMSAAERTRNVAGAFARRSGIRPTRGGVVVLVDDVRTTGATAQACFRVLREMYGGVRRGRGGVPGPVFVLATSAVSERRRGKNRVSGP